MDMRAAMASETVEFPAVQSTCDRVMAVLRGIRAAQPNGQPYASTSNLTDAGFTSMDMVRVMLGVEGAFDLMVPQDDITPENFRSAAAIAAMIDRLLQRA